MEERNIERIQQITNNIEKHKKAVLYSFFDTMEDTRIDNLEIVINEDERIRAIITFEYAQKVVYESSSLTFEQGFQKYLTWLNQNIFQNIKMYCKNILAYEDCGFIEYLEDSQSQQTINLQKYYYRLGALMVVLASLHINIEGIKIVKMGEQPVVKEFSGVIPAFTTFDKKSIMKNVMFSEIEKLYQEPYRSWFRKGREDVQKFMILHEEDIGQIVRMYFSNI